MRWIILASLAALALGGCGAAATPAPPRAALFSAPLPVGPPPHETAYTRNIIREDEWRATHSGQPQPAVGTTTIPQEQCGLLMKDTRNGLALVFTARKGESVDALRQRVRKIAREYNDRDADARILTQDLMRKKQHLAAHASEHNVPGGARLVLSTARRSDVGALRALMRWHAPDLLPGIRDEMGPLGPCPSLPKPVMG